MTLPASFPLSVSQINVELGRPAGAAFNITGAAERALAGVPSGPISFSDFLGKTNSGGSAASVLLLSSGVDINSGTANGVSFGDADAGRRIVVVIHSDGDGSDYTGITIGGVSATIHEQRGHFGGGTGLHLAIASAAVPSGTTGTVAISGGSAGVSGRRMAVYRLVGYSFLAAAGNRTVITATAVSADVSTSSGGLIIAGYTGSTNHAALEVDWTAGATSEQYDASTIVRRSGAINLNTSSGTTTVTAQPFGTGSVSNAGNELAVTSWSVS
jgi:hypothetical protein